MTEAADYAKIKEDVATLRNDVSSLIKLLEKEGLDKIKSLVDIDKVDDAVKQNPKESIAIAFAAGAVLALLLGRK